MTCVIHCLKTNFMSLDAYTRGKTCDFFLRWTRITRPPGVSLKACQPHACSTGERWQLKEDQTGMLDSSSQMTSILLFVSSCSSFCLFLLLLEVPNARPRQCFSVLTWLSYHGNGECLLYKSSPVIEHATVYICCMEQCLVFIRGQFIFKG